MRARTDEQCVRVERAWTHHVRRQRQLERLSADLREISGRRIEGAYRAGARGATDVTPRSTRVLAPHAARGRCVAHDEQVRAVENAAGEGAEGAVERAGPDLRF